MAGEQFVRLVNFNAVMGGFNELRDNLSGTTVYLTGSSTAYGVHLEFGTDKMPAYPWMRPAVDEFESSPESFLSKHRGVDIDDLETTEQVVKEVALALEVRMKDNVNAGTGGGRSPGTVSGHPQVQTGNLRASISSVKVR